MVVDGYQFDAGYQQRLKQAGLRLLWLDDDGLTRRYVADFVLNQNLGASATLYADRAPDTQLLLGPRYVLLRRPFLNWRTWERKIGPAAKKILVTLGGSDAANVTLRILEALPRALALEVTVLAGASNPNLESLQTYCSCTGDRLIVDARNMPELMAWADLAVSAAGSTTWELAFMGLPALLLVLAENQVAAAERLAQAGIFANLGWHYAGSTDLFAERLVELAGEPTRREQMSRKGRALVDGRGAERVVKAMLQCQ